MTARTLSTILDSLDEVKAGNEIPEFIVEEARRRLESYDSMYGEDPFAGVKHLPAWAGAAIHAAMMDQYQKNKLPARELAEIFGVPARFVSQRSRRLRKNNLKSSVSLEQEQEVQELINRVSEEEGIEGLMALVERAAETRREKYLRPPDMEPLRFVTGGLDVQVTVDGFGNFEDFRDNFEWTEEQTEKVTECLEEGYIDYYNYVHGEQITFNPYMLSERLADPVAFGFCWLVLYRSGGPASVMEDMARYMLALALEVFEESEFSHPPGLLIAIGELAGADVLKGAALKSALRLALSVHYCTNRMQRDDFKPLMRVLQEDGKLPLQTRVALAGKIIDQAGCNSNPHLPAQVYEDVISSGEEEFVDNLLTYTFAPDEAEEYFHVSRSARQLAAREMVRRAENAGETIKWLLTQAEAHHRADDYWSGLGEALEECFEEVPDELVRKCYERAICQARARTRKVFYQLAYQRLGEEVVDKALEDNAGSIRRWAEGKRF